MKLLPFVLLIVVLGCGENEEEYASQKASDNLNKMDSSIARLKATNVKLGDTNRKLDSLLKYIKYHNEYMYYQQLRDKMEIKYLRTRDEKYRTLGNKYEEEIVKYGKLSLTWKPSVSK